MYLRYICFSVIIFKFLCYDTHRGREESPWEHTGHVWRSEYNFQQSVLSCRGLWGSAQVVRLAEQERVHLESSHLLLKIVSRGVVVLTVVPALGS